MATRRQDRIHRLVQAIRQNDKLHLKEAASLLGVSEMTVRRDLSLTAGPLVLLGGYVVAEPRNAAVGSYLLTDQQTRQVAEKQHAANIAAGLIQPGHTVFFDCGTTTPCIINAIDAALAFTGVCYSLNTFLALQSKPHCRVILSGGEFCASNAIFKPLGFQNVCDNLCPDIGFFSAAGVDSQHGATCFNLDELPVKQWALRAARRHILVVDDSKFGKVRPACMGPLSAFDTIISNQQPPGSIRSLAQQEGIELLW